MKKIGIIGGLGPESTVDYYKEIIASFNKINNDGSLNYPEMIIYSVNMSVFIDHLKAGRLDEAAQYIGNALKSIEKAGAHFAAISANTPHLIFDKIKAYTNLPLISIVESAAQHAKSLGLKKTVLIGTSFTMKSSFYTDIFNKYDINISIPNESEMEYINQKLFNEIELGVYKEDTKREILKIISHMKDRDAIDSVVLGCTEFPIMFPDDEYENLKFINTTKTHISDIIKTCIA